MYACSNCSLYGNLLYLADIWIVLSHTAGMTKLSVDWLNPNQSASSHLNGPISRKPSVVSSCMHISRTWLLTVLHSISAALTAATLSVNVATVVRPGRPGRPC